MESQEEIDPSFEEIQEYLNKFEGGVITLEKDNTTKIATMCLKHPEKKNAITGSMMVNLRNHIEDLEKWSDGKAVILHGEKNFCSGGDLEFAIKSGNITGAKYISKWMQDTLKRLRELPLISVCLLSGPVLGGGAEISVYCDYLIAAEDVSFGFVHGKLDIVPAYGGASRLIQRLGYQKGIDLLLTSRILKADDCINTGLVETIVCKGSAYQSTVNWIKERLIHHHSVTRALKRIAVQADNATLEEALKIERNIFCPFWGCERNKNALKQKLKHL